MYRDPRGGHNRKSVNENFFKNWSPQMAYILGLIYSDGAIEDVRKSSRTCYVTITSKDKSLIKQVKQTLSSSHNIYVRNPQINKFPNGKSYLSSKHYILRIGNKKMFEDLLRLGVTPRKSLTLKLFPIPRKYFGFFLRGYFDGDGCLNSHLPRGKKTSIIKVIFTCGSFEFLDKLSKKLHEYIGSKLHRIHKNSGAFRLIYSTKESIKILNYMYSNLSTAPYLGRKHTQFQQVLKSRKAFILS